MSAATANPSSKEPRSARAEASVWIIRLHSEERTPELEAGLREWLDAHPENARQFEHITNVWELGGAVTADGLPRMRAWGSSALPKRWAFAAAAVMVCAVGLFIAHRWWNDAAYATGHGEQRLIRLDDGSRVYLNSDSRLRIEFVTHKRQVRLERGEGLFEVAKDPRRPFVVQAGDRQVTALGTSFVIRYEPARTAITLVEGKITVAPLSTPEEKEGEVILTPGQRLTFAKNSAPQRAISGNRPHIDTPRIDAVTAWRRGEVLLEATPLTEAISEMNRYDERQLVIDDMELASVRVSGIYRTGDSQGFARAVAELHRLKIVESPDEIHLQR